MNLTQQINNDLVKASKNGEALVRDTLRLAKTALKNTEIAKGRVLSEVEITEVLMKEVKQRQEAITAFQAGSRKDLAEKETREMTILQRYLPEQLTEAELLPLVDQTVAETGATGISDMGKVMAALMPKLKGQADGTLVSRLVKEKLTV